MMGRLDVLLSNMEQLFCLLIGRNFMTCYVYKLYIFNHDLWVGPTPEVRDSRTPPLHTAGAWEI